MTAFVTIHIDSGWQRIDLPYWLKLIFFGFCRVCAGNMGGAFLMTILLMPAKWLMFRLACQSLFGTDCFGFTVFLCGGCTGEFNGFAEVLLDASLNFIQRYMENSRRRLTRFTRREAKALCKAFSSVTASSEKMKAWTSKRKGTEASPSSSTRSCGSRRRVMPIL